MLGENKIQSAATSKITMETQSGSKWTRQHVAADFLLVILETIFVLMIISPFLAAAKMIPSSYSDAITAVMQ